MPHIPGHIGGAPWGGPAQAPQTAADVAASLIPGDVAGYRTPSMDWADLMRNVGRTWGQRVPLRDLRGQLEARYQLGGPTGGFSEFLGDYNPLSAEGLRARAIEAQRVGGMTEDEATAYALSEGAPETDPYLRAISLRGFFDPLAEGGEQRQFDAANLLAQQRAGGGQWQGRMAQNIQNAMQAMYNQRFGQGYGAGTFLDWYLGQTQ